MNWELVVNFTAVVTIQLLFFVICTIYYKDTNWRSYLWRGAIVGLIFGLGFDLYVGHYLHLFTYEFGFILPFLIVNGLLSYGTMFAHIFLLKQHSAVELFIPLIIVGAIYEFANFLFPVWEWTFAINSLQEYIYVITIGYTGLGIIMISFLALFTREKFNLVTK